MRRQIQIPESKNIPTPREKGIIFTSSQQISVHLYEEVTLRESENPVEEKIRRKERARLNASLSLASTMLAGILFFTGFGFYLSEKFHNIWLLLGGIFLGLFFSGYEVWKLVKLYSEEPNESQES